MLSVARIYSKEKVNLYRLLSEKDRDTFEKLKIKIEDRPYELSEYQELRNKSIDYARKYAKVKRRGVAYKDYDEANLNLFGLDVKFNINHYSLERNYRLQLYKLLDEEDIQKLDKLRIKIYDKGYVWEELLILEIELEDSIRRLSELDISQEDFENVVKKWHKVELLYLKDQERRLESGVGYGKNEIKFNIYKYMDKKDIETLKKLGINIEDRGIPFEEKIPLDYELAKYKITIFGSGISKEEAEKLHQKICNIIHINMNYAYEW